MDTSVYENQKNKSLKLILNCSKKLAEIKLDEFHELLEFIDNSIRQECQKIEKRYVKIVKSIHIKSKEEDEDFNWLSDTYSEDYFQTDKVFRNMLHYSYIVTLYAFLESQLNKMCDILKRYLDNIELRYTDLAGKGIKRAKTYLSKVVKVQFPANTNKWQEIQTFNKVRNIIVHCEGYIDASTKDGKHISKYAERHPQYVTLSDHKQMMLTQQYCLFITKEVRQFFEQLYSAFNV